MLLRPESFRGLCRARDLLREVEVPAPTIEAVARAAAISPFHFIRQFEAVFGVTPHQFRMNARLERAKELLVRGERSVTEVCLEVGFSSLGSFTTLFKRRVGATPSTYRRTLVAVPAALPGCCLTLMGRLPPDAFRAGFAVFEKPASSPAGRLPPCG